MPPVAPSEFPPPFDPADVIGPPTDAEDERIEVGIAIVGGGPAGLACANKVMQLLEDEPELTEKLGEVPVAVIEKGKVAGAHLLSGANMKPSAMEELFPDLPKEEWPVFQEVTKDAVYLLTSKAALPLKPMPPNFRNHGNYVTSVSKLGRFLAEKAEEAGVYILSETAATKLLVEDRVVKGDPLRRPRPRQGGRGARQLRARLRRRRQGDRARRGHRRPPHLRRLRLLRHARRRPDALGARGEGGLGGAEAARPGDPHDGLAAAQVAALQRVRRQLHLPDGRGQALHRPRRRPRLHRRDLQRPRRPAAAQDPPLRQGSARGRQTRRLGRQDDSLRRLLRDAQAPRRARHGRRRRRGQHGQRADPEGRPLRDARRDVRGGDDRRVAQAGLGQLRGLRREGPQVPDREGPLRIAQHAPALLQRLLPRWRLRLGDDDHQRQLPRRPLEAGARLRGRDGPGQGGRHVRQARQRAHLRQARLGLPLRQRDPRRRPQPRPHPGQGAARDRPDLGLDVPGPGLRDPRGAARRTAPPRSTSTSPPPTASSAARSPPRAGA